MRTAKRPAEIRCRPLFLRLCRKVSAAEAAGYCSCAAG